MARTSGKSMFLRGMRDGLPFVLVVGPFGLLFGVIGTEAGLNLAEVMGFTVLVIAGASQITAISLMQENAPILVILVTALAVNLRMAMYSASLVPYLGAAPFWQRGILAYFLVDQSYALAHLEYEKNPERPLGEKMAYFAGTMMVTAPSWYGMTWVGAVLGEAIPDSFALDFAIPITFLALIAPALKTAAHVAAATTSVLLALALAWMPYGTGLLVAAVCAMAVGAAVEIAMEKRA
ncbi:MAG: AzlC family ABC transporter permease [Mangrovicoccus sp.]|nr:AzlC family ABC transporter permease [Mangrovicoccus sp.]